MDQTQLIALLAGLLSADNEQRKAAEAQYDAIATPQPAWMMHALAEICATTQDTASVTLVFILLRKLFNMTQEFPDGQSRSAFLTADAETQKAVKGRLLEVLGTAAFGPQRGSAASCVGALAVAVHKGQQTWDELWGSVFQIIAAEDSAPELKIICCEIISMVGSNLVDFFEKHRANLAQGLSVCLNSTVSNKSLKLAAFKAIITLVPLGFKDDFVALVPAMLTAVQECLNSADWETAESLLVSIVEGISDSPQLFEPQAMSLLSGLMQVAASQPTPKEVRHAAVEGLLTFCEELPKTARKVPQFTTSFFELLYQYSLTPDFPSDWDTTIDLEAENADTDDATDFLIACAGLDRLSNAIGGRKLKDTAQRLFMAGIQSPDWQQRHAAISMICHITEGMQAAFEKQLGTLVSAVLTHVKDEVKYVRSIAMECIAQLCQDFAPDLQNTYHQQILPDVVGALRDPIPHVAGSSARCLDSFLDFLTGDEVDPDEKETDASRTFAPYAAKISEDCVTLLKSTPVLPVREAALGALSSLTSTIGAAMSPYAQHLVPVYQEVLAQPDSPDIMSSKCKAIECVTLLAAGVGKEVMGPYAQSICEFLKGLCQQGLQNDDPRFRYVLRGWTCMVECLKEDSLPYVNGVMPMLINLMDLDCDVVITEVPVGEDEADTTEAEQAAGVESLRIVIPGLGERVAKMHTSLIEDKELASNVVNAIMTELGALLQDYFPQIARSAIKLLDFKVNDSIRETGALLLTSVMEGYTELRSPDSQALASEALGPLLEALAEEPEADITATLMECVSHCVSSFPSIVTPQSIQLISEKLTATLSVMVEKRKALLTKKAAEHDEDEIDNLDAEDYGLQQNIRSTTDLIGTLLESTSAVFGPIFSEKFFPLVAAWLQPSEDDFFVSRALVIICDFVEHAPQQVAGVLPTLLSSSLAFGSSRTDDALLQADFYLINNLLQYLSNAANNVTGVSAADFATQSQQVISRYLASAPATTEEYRGTTDNAASVYVTLLQHYSAALGPATVAQVLQTLTAVLPCVEDDVEAQRVHDRVLAWITGNHPVLQSNPQAVQTLLARIKAADQDNLSPTAKQLLATL